LAEHPRLIMAPQSAHERLRAQVIRLGSYEGGAQSP
jgi:hypothetical protein